MTNLKFLRRRQFLHLAAVAAALPVLPRIARAQAYPTRPVRWITGSAPGGTADILMRLLGPRLSQRLGQPFVIENPGAGGNISTEAVVRVPRDGYTLLTVGPDAAINAPLYDRLNFNGSTIVQGKKMHTALANLLTQWGTHGLSTMSPEIAAFFVTSHA
jgi:tripartite-type tricarboxylate transporter receptor subunit TctC